MLEGCKKSCRRGAAAGIESPTLGNLRECYVFVLIATWHPVISCGHVLATKNKINMTPASGARSHFCSNCKTVQMQVTIFHQRSAEHIFCSFLLQIAASFSSVSVILQWKVGFPSNFQVSVKFPGFRQISRFPSNFQVSVKFPGFRQISRFPSNFQVSVKFPGFRQISRFPSNFQVSVKFPGFRQISRFPSNFQVSVKFPGFRQISRIPSNFRVSVKFPGFRQISRFPSNFQVSVKFPGFRQISRFPSNFQVSVKFPGFL